MIRRIATPRASKRERLVRLRNKVALISGAAHGIGAATARLFAGEGAKIGLADIHEENGQRLEREITTGGAQAFFLRMDATREQDWQQTVAAMVSRFGRLDVLVNSAGIYRRANLEQTTVEEWDRVMSINVRGVFLGTKAAIPAMRKAGGGSIINLSSVSGLIGGPYSTAYNASKGAVRLLTKSTAVQYAREGIRCNSVHPAPVETDMLTLVFPDEQSRRERLAEIPMGRFGTAEEVARALLFLASDESSYMTGSELVIDGGLTAR